MQKRTTSSAPSNGPRSHRVALYTGTGYAQSQTPGAIADQCGPVIYAVRLKDGIIKIGHTTRIRARLSRLECGLNDILAIIPGTVREEKQIHDGLVAHRARAREYYHPHADVFAVVNRMRAKYNFAAIEATTTPPGP